VQAAASDLHDVLKALKAQRPQTATPLRTTIVGHHAPNRAARPLWVTTAWEISP